MSGSVKHSGRAVLLLGHGSPVAEANETLREVALSVRGSGGYASVEPAFLQIEKPDFLQGVDKMVDEGFNDIVVMPFFLYMGAHVTKDLPRLMEEAQRKHPDLKMTLTQSLGYHQKLVDITVERIEGNNGAAAAPPAITPGPLRPHPIEAESFNIITEELGENSFSEEELPVVKRVIHTSADFEFKDILSFSPGALKAGTGALRGGGNVVTDVRMIKAGINRLRLAAFGGGLFCFSSDADVARRAKEEGSTKTAASMRKGAEYMKGGVVAIGNAPTALMELLKLIKSGEASPALIVGVPVGFVGAEEAKEALLGSGVEYITSRGKKGGSTVAVAIVNALLIEACGGYAPATNSL
ncbi:MAG: precorrin-8X methylmutase [Thermodesulfobacteriota bacterium]